jgi:undecaprenyl-diphosphatase
VLVLLCSWAVDPATVGGLERAVFRSVNELPGWIYPPTWVLMQFGTFITIPLSAAAAVLMRSVRLGCELLVAGIGAWLLAKLVKDLFPRGRPGALLDAVELRGVGAGGRGFPSGHAAVAAAMAFVLFAWLPGRWRWLPVGLGAIVCFGRVYVGAHLPLDVVGGAALGVAVGALTTALGGRRVETGAASDPGTASHPGTAVRHP